MGDRTHLGEFELVVMLALLRLGENAYGVPISREIERQCGREAALGSVYATLDRLQRKGFVSSSLGEPTAESGRQSQAIFPRYDQGTARGAGNTTGTDQNVGRSSGTGRIGMKSHPPSLATWLLEHLIRREDNEALAGDLSEEFAQGRSVTWYWYQVFVAILVALSKELRTRWVTILFAVLVSGVVSYRQIWHSFEFEGLFTWGIKLPWPVSLVFTIALWSAAERLVFVVAFSAYLGAIRRLNSQLLERRVGSPGFAQSWEPSFILPIDSRPSRRSLLYRDLAIAPIFQPCAGDVGSTTKSSTFRIGDTPYIGILI